jgi:signal transduction histidine kinase
MMGLAVIWVAASLVAAGIALHYLFGINIERSTREEMDAALTRLAAVIVSSLDGPHLSAPLPDPRYSTPFGGRYWQIEALDTGVILRSRSLWDFVIDASTGGDGLYNGPGPDDRQLIVLTRKLEVASEAGPQEYLVTIAQDHGPIQAATRGFARDLTQVLIVLGTLVILAAWLHIKLGLSPITALRLAIEGVRRGDRARLEGSFPSELQPLVQEVNGLLDAREAMMERARARAADLAHGLKTPLAAVHGIAERLRGKGNDADADLLQDLSFEMSERVDYQMRLAALRVRTTAHSMRSSLNTAVIRTLTVLKKTSRGESLNWVAHLAEDCWVDVHRQDLMELVGITLENAAKWASSRVTVSSINRGDHVILEICDDGPGIPFEQLQSLGKRGVRLDQSLPGSGLGLAIAAEILDLNRGSIAFSDAQAGGLVVTLRLPLANSEPPLLS